MSENLDPLDDASTPLSHEEKDGLLPSYITLRSELNEAEQVNILEAEMWVAKQKRQVLQEDFLKKLHKKMFENVWKWAGKFRQSERNIGVDAYKIASELKQLINDCQYWVTHETYEPDEIAIRFHHRLVFIHPFPNGNGRHARLATDLLLISLGRPRFSWGDENLQQVGETRTQYINVLQIADKHDIKPLLKFARSKSKKNNV